MKQIICNEPERLSFIDVEKPLLAPKHALVKIQRIGICGTDLHAFKGDQPLFTYPRILGHELSGTIEEVYQKESNFEKGDQVAIIPYLHCENCAACKLGKTNCCARLKVIGVHKDGGMQEYLAVPLQNLIQINDLTLDEAVLLEPLAIGAHAIRRAKIEEGDEILVIGAGPIGLGVMLLAKEIGAKVMAMDVNKQRLKFCEDWLGVEETIDALGAPAEELTCITNGMFVPTVFDATGNKQSMETAFNYISYGGQLIYVGLVKQPIQFYDPDFHKRETTLLGSRNATLEDFQFVHDVLKKRNIDISAFITHRTSFHNVIKTFPSWLKTDSNVIKAVVELN
ncbi:zinc-binding alcohol dehydrogenase family protein [Salipaludibacillus sp. CF4.18]|uniref:zinc-binding alcohol dehydrogenase family protein n=1 Tax=Salipaludibacillus sp. CF4.18 TaxID=3373081 RepID=UPI003EE63CFA